MEMAHVTASTGHYRAIYAKYLDTFREMDLTTNYTLIKREVYIP